MKGKIYLSIIVFIIIFGVCGNVLAAELNTGYNYDSRQGVVPAPNPYVVESVVTGDSLGIGNFKGPTEMFVEKWTKEMYILDAGNGRIIVLDTNLKLSRVISTFSDAQGEQKLSNNANGLFVTKDGTIYIADTGNDRILICNPKGVILKILKKPVNELIDPKVAYQPMKVLVDSSNLVYVISANISSGAVTVDKDGNFMGFYGANHIQTTFKLLQELFWRKFLTKAQTAVSGSFQPIAYSNFDIDKKDFIYTVTSFSGEGGDKGQIKKLNPMGNNLFNEIAYGDVQLDKTKVTSFVDINVDDNDFINALDGTNGKIFQYDQESNLLFVFGGKGSTLGTFKQPLAIENMNDKIVVLDSGKNYITVFKPTLFAKKVREAVSKYKEGLYIEALQPWKEVVQLDSNYEMAYIGMGKALALESRYTEAMRNFYIGNDKKDYSKAKKMYRNQWIRSHFSILASMLFLIILFVHFLNKRKIILLHFKYSFTGGHKYEG